MKLLVTEQRATTGGPTSGSFGLTMPDAHCVAESCVPS